jgi:hypothetical protein
MTAKYNIQSNRRVSKLLHSNLASQSAEAFCIRLASADIVVHADVAGPDTGRNTRGDSVGSALAMRDHDVVATDASLFLLARLGQDLVEASPARSVSAVRLGRNGHDTVSVGGGTLDDGSRPRKNEGVGDPVHFGRYSLALCVKENDSPETRLFEHRGVDELHLGQGAEKLLLNIEGREGPIRQGLEPALHALKEVIITDRLLQRGPSIQDVDKSLVKNAVRNTHLRRTSIT